MFTKKDTLYFIMNIHYNEDAFDSDCEFVTQQLLLNDNVGYQGNFAYISDNEDDLIKALRKLYSIFSHIKDITDEILIYSVIDIKIVNYDAVFEKGKLN